LHHRGSLPYKSSWLKFNDCAGSGSDASRFSGVRLCRAAPLAAHGVEAAVWAEVCTLLQDPGRIEQEDSRPWRAAQAAPAPPTDQANTIHLSKLRQGLARLIDSHTEGFITKDEFEPRISRLRQRIAQVEDDLRRERDEASALHEMRLLMD
jgi:site-specific DNA recombinase